MIELICWVWLWVISGMTLVKIMDCALPEPSACYKVYTVAGILGFLFVIAGILAFLWIVTDNSIKRRKR